MKLTSSRPKNTDVAAIPSIKALIICGGEYGNFSSHLLPANRLGYEATGSLVKPPIIGPIMTPIFAHMGSNRKALDWNLHHITTLALSAQMSGIRTHFFSLIISLIIVLITPTFPLSAPPRLRNTNAWAKDVENPSPIHESMAPRSPNKMTPFRPLWSDTRPQTMAVQSWEAANADCMIPA